MRRQAHTCGVVSEPSAVNLVYCLQHSAQDHAIVILLCCSASVCNLLVDELLCLTVSCIRLTATADNHGAD